VNTFSLHKA